MDVYTQYIHIMAFPTGKPLITVFQLGRASTSLRWYLIHGLCQGLFKIQSNFLPSFQKNHCGCSSRFWKDTAYFFHFSLPITFSYILPDDAGRCMDIASCENLYHFSSTAYLHASAFFKLICGLIYFQQFSHFTDYWWIVGDCDDERIVPLFSKILRTQNEMR